MPSVKVFRVVKEEYEASVVHSDLNTDIPFHPQEALFWFGLDACQQSARARLAQRITLASTKGSPLIDKFQLITWTFWSPKSNSVDSSSV